MFGFFKRRKEHIRFEDVPRYSHTWADTRQPGPGAESYAFKSLGLVSFTPIGPSAFIQEPIRSIAPPLYQRQTVDVAGIPLTAGSIYGNPLTNPDAV